MRNWIEDIKFYYANGNGVWDKQRVKNVVGKVITEIEYEEITGESYTL